jgi:hypothetical protein
VPGQEDPKRQDRQQRERGEGQRRPPGREGAELRHAKGRPQHHPNDLANGRSPDEAFERDEGHDACLLQQHQGHGKRDEERRIEKPGRREQEAQDVQIADGDAARPGQGGRQYTAMAGTSNQASASLKTTSKTKSEYRDRQKSSQRNLGSPAAAEELFMKIFVSSRRASVWAACRPGRALAPCIMETGSGWNDPNPEPLWAYRLHRPPFEWGSGPARRTGLGERAGFR